MKNPFSGFPPFNNSCSAGRRFIRWVRPVVFWMIVSCPGTAAGEVRINELYYDHPGTDSGYEFIELFNSAVLPVSLGGYALEFHNGAGEGWDRLWTAGLNDSIPAGRPFVIGGDAVEPAPDVITSWSLQNGPDAIRLIHLDTTVDLVGYGNLEDPGYVEGTSAPKVQPGQSLARMPDGADTDDNKHDFQPAEPSPGRLNTPQNDISIQPGDGIPAAAAVETGAAEQIRFGLTNRGTLEVAAGGVEVQLWDSTSAGSNLSQQVLAPALSTGSEVTVMLSVVFTEGVHFLIGRAVYPPDERPNNNSCRLIRRAGSPPVLISEIMSDPPGNCPQYIELYNAGSQAVDIENFHLRDSSGNFVSVTPESFEIDPRSCLVITPDGEGLGFHFPFLAPGQVVEVEGSWPYFNRSGSGGFADSVILADSYRIPVDGVDYPPQPSSHRGKSLERVDLFVGSRRPVWVLSRAPGGGSPGRPFEASLLQPPRPESMTLSPNPFSPEAGENLCIAVDPDGPVSRVILSVYDLSGRRIRDLGSTAVFPYVFVWNGVTESGRTVSPGLYIVAGEYYSTDGRRAEVEKVVVGCGRLQN